MTLLTAAATSVEDDRLGTLILLGIALAWLAGYAILCKVRPVEAKSGRVRLGVRLFNAWRDRTTVGAAFTTRREG